MRLSLLVVVMLLAGCASSTLYQHAATPEARGYRSFALTADRYRVSFTGNSLTPRETVETYALYRAAEVALKAGHQHFKLVSTDTEALTAYQGTGVGFGGVFGGFWNGPFFGSGIGVSSAQPVTHYRTVAQIKVGPKIDASEGEDIYNARALIDQLEARVQRPATPD